MTKLAAFKEKVKADNGFSIFTLVVAVGLTAVMLWNLIR